MKNKLPLFAVPYVGWLALFVVAPILIMVVYACLLYTSPSPRDCS